MAFWRQMEGPYSSYCALVWALMAYSGEDPTTEPPYHTAYLCLSWDTTLHSYLISLPSFNCLECSLARALTNLVRSLSLIHISEPTRLLSISYAVFCLKKKKKKT
eukprot:TRINITY_DN31140_c0_g1_i2.p2 TRINITY_DN31140_c0_g1~~TRINITY_DN31140_c0_g1_i2.p2  ORF type:complete len:105 (+),score=22.41 TRINITY_DN31140_c0_g1_i2:246-560(+)